MIRSRNSMLLAGNAIERARPLQQIVVDHPRTGTGLQMIASLRNELAGAAMTRSAFLRCLSAGALTIGLGVSAGSAIAAKRRAVPPVTDIDRFYDAWQDRFNAADMAGMLDLYVTDVVYITPEGRQVAGHAGVRADFAAMFALKPVIDLHDRRHILYRDTAITTNHWTLTIPGPNGPQKTSGGGIEVIRKQADGGWRFIIDDASRSAVGA
jgi:uncharacterized protein (TIGR02246 family)